MPATSHKLKSELLLTKETRQPHGEHRKSRKDGGQPALKKKKSIAIH